MKRLIIAAASVLVLASCQEKQGGAFILSGKIKNAGKARLYLQELPYNGNAPVVIDSATLKENGHFELRGPGKEESLYRVTIENGPEFFFINDNNRIRVVYDINDYRRPDFDGSAASDELYQFVNGYLQRDSMVRTVFYQIETLTQQGNDSAVAQLQQQGLQRLRELNAFLNAFVQKTESPAAAYFAINRGMQSMTREEVTALANQAFKRFPEHAGMAVLKSQLSVSAADAAPAYALLNQQAPELQMPDVNGKPMRLSQFRGKYVLVDFWASWCAPCRRENPNVVAAYQKFKDRNFTIVGVSLDENREDWVKAITDDKLAWHHMSDLKQWQSAAVSAYKFDGIPFNVLLDPNGKIIAHGLRGAELEKKLSELIK